MLLREAAVADEGAGWQSFLLDVPRGGQLYVEKVDGEYDVWFFPHKAKGDPADNQEGEKRLLSDASEFEAQMLVDYYLGGHHENRDSL